MCVHSTAHRKWSTISERERDNGGHFLSAIARQHNTTPCEARQARSMAMSHRTVDVPPRPKETEGRMRTARQRREVWERRYSRVDDVIVRGGEGRGWDRMGIG